MARIPEENSESWNRAVGPKKNPAEAGLVYLRASRCFFAHPGVPVVSKNTNDG
jgi:hypothetical protein